MTEAATKIRHPKAHHVFIERHSYGKWIAHTGISLFVDGDFDTQEEAISACNVKPIFRGIVELHDAISATSK